jgi:hypothetical protein
MDIQSQIDAAKQVGYTATVKTFGEKFFAGWQGILLNPGQIVMTMDQFARFVAAGCKDPENYREGYGFQSVLYRDINEVLADLYEKQRLTAAPQSPDVAAQYPVSSEDIEGYARRKEQIAYLEEERIRIQKWFDSLIGETPLRR